MQESLNVNVPAQMKAAATATMNVLKNRLTGRNKELVELHALLEATKAQWLAHTPTPSWI